MTGARWWLEPAEKVVGSHVERPLLSGHKAHAICVCVNLIN